ncbi:MAG: protein kinase [Myxococcota bacterium]|jgi:serine/threonine-protein kinase|nr:protein kinase [Myxococcota bacterium]
MRQTREFGRFRLMDRVASGGMAEIYRALCTDEFGQPQVVALKLMLPHCNDDRDFIEMMRDEAKITRHLRHLNLARVLEFGQVDGKHYLAIEFIDGRDLRAILRASRERQEYLPVEHVLYLMASVLEGIHSAHIQTDERGRPLQVIHRDISPSNILVPYSGPVKVIDFGIAKAAFSKVRTRIGVVKGKVRYMSPEQSLGKKLDLRTDIFSAGVVLYEALTLRAPFAAPTEPEMIERIRTEDPQLPSSIDPAIPRELDAILARALAKRRSARYQSAAEFAAALHELLQRRYPGYQPVWLGEYVAELFQQVRNDDRRIVDEYLAGGDMREEGATDQLTRLPRPARPSWIRRLLGKLGKSSRDTAARPEADAAPLRVTDPLVATDRSASAHAAGAAGPYPIPVPDWSSSDTPAPSPSSPILIQRAADTEPATATPASPTPYHSPTTERPLPLPAEHPRQPPMPSRTPDAPAVVPSPLRWAQLDFQPGPSAARSPSAGFLPVIAGTGERELVASAQPVPGPLEPDGRTHTPEPETIILISAPNSPVADPSSPPPQGLSHQRVGELPTLPRAAIVPPDPPTPFVDQERAARPELVTGPAPGEADGGFGCLPTRSVESPFPPELLERERVEAPRAISKIALAHEGVALGLAPPAPAPLRPGPPSPFTVVDPAPPPIDEPPADRTAASADESAPTLVVAVGPDEDRG